MFEGWAADMVAAYLGRFVDVQRDQLRISLWSGELRPYWHRLLCSCKGTPRRNECSDA